MSLQYIISSTCQIMSISVFSQRTAYKVYYFFSLFVTVSVDMWVGLNPIWNFTTCTDFESDNEYLV